MADTLYHRGPDSYGYWIDKIAGVALGHRRLAVVDLTSAGNQPMVSISGRYTIVFNGEIYNHLDIRRSIEENGNYQSWRGHSDTETLLSAFELWGVRKTIKRCVGMFAFAVWDKQTHTLVLGRDRFGEKPLYYGVQGTGDDAVFMFGSEINAFHKHPDFKPRINRDALSLLMSYNYIPCPHSIYLGIYKLPPASLLTVVPGNLDYQIEAYWSVDECANAGLLNPFTGNEKEAIDTLENTLISTIRQQITADVPLGAFLSGGIDSSTIVALMQCQSKVPIKTFTIGFEEKGYSEAEHAKLVAEHLGTDHCELYVTPSQALHVVSKLPYIYSEPFADSSQIPTFLVSQLAKEYVTVSLSGDGGDELFGGYNRYKITQSLWRKLSLIPLPLRKIIARGITNISPQTWTDLLIKLPWTSIGDKLHKGADVMCGSSFDEIYYRMISSWPDNSQLVIGAKTANNYTFLTNSITSKLDIIDRMMLLDSLTYLPDDILVKVDRAAMANSLETRVPFLDHRVVDFAWRLPSRYKINNGITKWILRQVLYRHVPKSLIERPKMGFGFPIDKWLRGPMRDWAESLINEKRIINEGYFYPNAITSKWNEHISGKRNWSSQLWAILMFQAWLEANEKI